MEARQKRILKLLRESFLTIDKLKKISAPLKKEMKDYGLTGEVKLDSTHSLDGTALKSAIAVIFNDEGKVLMGTSAADDWRFGKLCFVGGGIEPGESISEGSVREAWEESGLIVLPRLSNPLINKNIGFVICDYIKGEIKHNNEFVDMDWYSINNDLPENMFEPNKLYINYIKQRYI